MKKLFVFGDVHSFYDEFMEALDKAGFDINNPDHIIVSLGDLCDRGPKSREVLSFVNSIPDDRKLLTIGNHEILMELMIKRGYPNGVDTYNGVVNTAIDITEKDEGIEDLKHNRFWNEYKKNRHWYHEIGDYIFIHGWIPCFPKSSDYDYTEYQYMPDWRRSRIEDLYEATYLNGMEMWSNGIRETGKTIFCGHWHTSWGHYHLHHKGAESPEKRKAILDPFIDEGIVALDASTPNSHKVNVYVLEMPEGFI